MIYCIKYIAERKKGHETEFERILVIMKKKQSLIIIIESVLVVWLAVFMLAELEHRQDRKEVFINKVYFLLTDISNDFINKILSFVIGGNPLPLGGGRSLVNS